MEAIAHVLWGPAVAISIEAAGGAAFWKAVNTRPRAAAWGITQITPACIQGRWCKNGKCIETFICTMLTPA
jgi:hypothetical protein